MTALFFTTNLAHSRALSLLGRLLRELTELPSVL